MTTSEYHQLLKFLYFEGYADSYEEAEYMIEEMNDEDFEALCEDVFPQFTQEELEILEYLMNEGYASDGQSALVILENMSDDWRDSVVEATAMAKRGHDETAIRNKIAKSTGGGGAADRATALADKQTYGQRGVNPQARQRLAAKQRGDFRNTTSSNPGLHGYGHQSNNPAVKAKQAARGAQRGVLTSAEKRSMGR